MLKRISLSFLILLAMSSCANIKHENRVLASSNQEDILKNASEVKENIESVSSPNSETDSSEYVSAKNGYNDYYCWNVDAEGKIIENSMANLKKCQTGYISAKRGYISYHCWPVDKDGNILGSNSVDDSNCTAGHKILTNGYNQERCWPIDEKENVLGNSFVDMSFCTSK